MARVQNVLIGKTNGSVGNATFTQWKGEQILKSKAVNNYSNPTETQLQNNAKFAVMTAFARSILVYIQLGFKALAIKKSEYNAFTQENKYSQVVIGSPGSYVVDTENLIVSKGPEFQEGIATATKQADGTNGILVGWSANNFTRTTDTVYGLLFERATGTFIQAKSEYVSGEEFLFTGTGFGTNIADYDIYVFYVNGTNGRACDSRKL